MTKKEKEIFNNWCKNYNIDYRTIGMIVHHYIDIGERAAAKITKDQIDHYYKKSVEEDKAARAQGKISMITPDFVAYLLTACMGLYQLDATTRYKIIGEYL